MNTIYHYDSDEKVALHAADLGCKFAVLCTTAPESLGWVNYTLHQSRQAAVREYRSWCVDDYDARLTRVEDDGLKTLRLSGPQLLKDRFAAP